MPEMRSIGASKIYPLTSESFQPSLVFDNQNTFLEKEPLKQNVEIYEIDTKNHKTITPHIFTNLYITFFPLAHFSLLCCLTTQIYSNTCQYTQLLMIS